MSLKRLGFIGAVAGLVLIAAFWFYTPQQSTTSSTWQQLLTWFFMQQRYFRQEMVTILRELHANSGWDAGSWLIFASFIYGIFHAAGPGHGKAVLSTYLLTNHVRARRGIGIAVSAAFCQGLVAIFLVYGLIWLAGWRSSETMTAVTWSERLSYVLLTILGCWWVLQAFMPLWKLRYRTHSHECIHGQSHGHEEKHSHCGCGHAHAPSLEQLEKVDGLKTAAALVLAIGSRPCSGAVLVLVFAYAIDIPWAGILAALCMAAGTAITVSTLALLAVKAHDLGGNLIGKGLSRRFLPVLAVCLKFTCGAILIALGSSMLWFSFSSRLAAGVL